MTIQELLLALEKSPRGTGAWRVEDAVVHYVSDKPGFVEPGEKRERIPVEVRTVTLNLADKVVGNVYFEENGVVIKHILVGRDVAFGLVPKIVRDLVA